MWQPDGWGGTRIGVLTPHADINPESEFNAMAPGGISIHAARVPLRVYKPGGVMDPTIADEPVRAFADPPLVDDAAELLASAPLHAIVYAFTSSSYVRGRADDAKLKQRLETRTRGIPVVISSAAAVAALKVLNATTLALVSPPWFSAEMDRQGARYFQASGFDVVHNGPAGLPSDQQAIRPGDLFEWVRTSYPQERAGCLYRRQRLPRRGSCQGSRGKSRDSRSYSKPSLVLASPPAVWIAGVNHELWPDIQS